MNRCLYCKSRMLARARNGNVKATCGAPECLKDRERERKRTVRAKARGDAPAALPQPQPASGAKGAFMSPWGHVYASEMEAWADCLFTGGLDGLGEVSSEVQYERRQMLSAVTPSAD